MGGDGRLRRENGLGASTRAVAAPSLSTFSNGATRRSIHCCQQACKHSIALGGTDSIVGVHVAPSKSDL